VQHEIATKLSTLRRSVLRTIFAVGKLFTGASDSALMLTLCALQMLVLLLLLLLLLLLFNQ